MDCDQFAIPHWHVLGAGAIGSLYAHALHRSGCTTSLILRGNTKQRTTTVTVERDATTYRDQLNVLDREGEDTISHLLVTTKAFDVADAVAEIADRLHQTSILLLMVNGMGIAERLHADHPGLNIFCGTTTEGAYRLGPRHIRHAGHGETRIGRQGQAAIPQWFATWHNAIDQCHWDADIESALWSKLAVNCVINPLTAVHGCRNGELAEQPELANHVASLCAEVSTICAAAGHTGLARALPEKVAAVIRQTAANRSSMLQDVEHQRPTEIDYINGYLLQVADKTKIDAPLNSQLVQRVQSYDH